MRKLLILSLFLLSGCPGGPTVDVCISSADKAHGLDCVDKKEKPFILPYEGSRNFVCFSPNDARTLFEYCRLNKENGE